MSQTILHLTDQPPRVTRKETSVSGKTLDVATARDLVARTSRRPWEGDKTVIHIVNGDQVSDDCWNTLLKVLEEPPPYVQFHLYSPSLDSIPRTIKSRSHVIRESIPQENYEDITRLIRYVRNGEAGAIIREADRHTKASECRSQMKALINWGVVHGDMDVVNISEYYLEGFLNKGVSPKVTMKTLLLQLAVRYKQRESV